MDHYLEAGGNVIDTAECYACWLPGGEHQSEKVIGEWSRERGTRDQIVLSTKGAHPKLESMDVPRLSKAEIQVDLDSSLRRLGVEQIDLYWLHRDSPGYPVAEILESLEAFRKAGKIKHAGFSNWTQSRAEGKPALRRNAWESRALSQVKTCGAWRSPTSRKPIRRGALSTTHLSAGTSSMVSRRLPT